MGIVWVLLIHDYGIVSFEYLISTTVSMKLIIVDSCAEVHYGLVT